MKKTPILLTALAMGILTTATQAAVIFSDNFSDGNRDGWYVSTTGTSTAVTSQQLVLTSTSASANTLTYFTPTTLAIGDIMTLSFDVSFSNTTSADNNLRVALLNSGGAANQINSDLATFNDAAFNGYVGYAGFHNRGGSANAIRSRAGSNNTLFTTNAGGFATSLANNTSALNLVADTFYNYTLTYAYNTASEFVITASLNSVPISHTITSSPVTTFDTIALFQVSSGATTLDNFTVTVIPEPSTWALLAVSLTAMVVLRRRRANA